jgi:RNase P subunit RPR2
METEMVKLLGSIEAVVNGGKAIVSADNSIIVAMMQEALRHGRSLTFYVSPAQADALMRWYWTPRRVKEIGMETVSKEERDKIASALGFKCTGTCYSNRVQCSCGGVYGMFEFMQQGLRQHDRDWIKKVLELKNTSVIRINPALDAFCPLCNQIIITGHWYSMREPDKETLIYGCCSGGDILALA